jgi:hypothetical protein
MEQKLTKEELIKLVEEIRAVKYRTEEEGEILCDLFDSHFLYPAASSLIYFHKPRLTPEEIVEKALSYKPIILGPPSPIEKK